MQPIYLFSGRIGSGKSHLSKIIALRLGLARVGFGDVVRAEAERRGLDTLDKAVLQQLGQQLVINEPEKFCSDVLSFLPENGMSGGVIDGLRHRHIFDSLGRLFGRERLRLVFVAIDENVRRIRLAENRNWALKDMEGYDSDATEEQVATSLPGLADFTVDNSFSVEESIAALMQWASA